MRAPRLLLAIVAAALLSVGAGAAMTAVASQPSVPAGRAEQIASSWMARWPGTGPGPWVATGVHAVSVRRPSLLPWVTVDTAAWAVELQSPSGQAQVIVDRRSGTVLTATASTA